ncbi:MAG: amidohydrolase [Deltaproteobacteria bacterium]|nr:amidohydrolase [Deltaproteobacteria bacterium]
MELKDIQAVDTMNRPTYFSHDICKELFKSFEYHTMAHSTFKSVLLRMGLKDGEEWRTNEGQPSIEAMVKEMDEIGVQYSFVDQMLFWSYRDHRPICNLSVDKLAEMIAPAKGRVIGGAGYNPWRIEESLRDIEHAVKDLGFKYVWAHPLSFGMKHDQAKFYPLYQKCGELGVPCCMQVGHSAEPLPSECGHPYNCEEIARDFPNTTFVLTHTGWPWVGEWVSTVWRYANVYGNIGAYYPSGLDPMVPQRIRGQIRDKVMWATNGLNMTRCKEEFLALPLKDDAKKLILRDTAMKVFKLDE